MFGNVGAVVVHDAEGGDGALCNRGDARANGPLARHLCRAFPGIGSAERCAYVVWLDVLCGQLRKDLARNLWMALVNGGS